MAANSLVKARVGQPQQAQPHVVRLPRDIVKDGEQRRQRSLGVGVERRRAQARDGAPRALRRRTQRQWAAAHWRPEDGLPEPESWRRLAAPLWDETADTVALDLVRTRSDEQRAGQCGMKSPRATAES